MIELIFACAWTLVAIGLIFYGADHCSPSCAECEKRIHPWQRCRIIAMPALGFRGMYAHTKCVPYRHWIGRRMWDRTRMAAWSTKVEFMKIAGLFSGRARRWLEKPY